jgi:hypothetical protein
MLNQHRATHCNSLISVVLIGYLAGAGADDRSVAPLKKAKKE